MGLFRIGCQATKCRADDRGSETLLHCAALAGRMTDSHETHTEVVDRVRYLMTEIRRACPHCGSRLKKWLVPDEASWNEEFFFVCFNDDCSYYEEGWEWMKEQYNQKASYRYMANPTTGASAPLPVWSHAAMRELIAEDDEGGDQ